MTARKMGVAFLLVYLCVAGLFLANQSQGRDIDVRCGMDRAVFFGPSGNDTQINQQEYLENLRNENRLCYFYAEYLEAIIVFLFMGPFAILGPWGIIFAPLNLLLFPIVGYAVGKRMFRR